MAVPGQDVLDNLDQLITAVTGFTQDHVNFEPCRRYCLSHFVHHNYASINKSTVRQTIDDLENRFYTHGHFELSRALRTQVDQFLSHESTFKANPECQIEWNLLSFVTSLATNLSSLHKVPPLLPDTDETKSKDDFDWGNYLKEGLPVYNYDTDSDSFSSLSSDENETSFQTAEQSIATPDSADVPERGEIGDYFEIRKIYLNKVRAKEKNFSTDVATKFDFATKWQNLKSPGDPFFLVSEKEVVEVVLKCLMTGDSLDGLKNATVCFLTKETFQGCLDSFLPFLTAVESINEFTAFVETFDGSPVVSKVYASCLRRALMCYELKLSDASQEKPSLIRVIEMMKPCLPYVLGLSTVHSLCWPALPTDEPPWKTSLRILAGLYTCMITSHNQKLRSLFAGMFLECHAVFGRIIDALLTSSSATDLCQEFYISREVPENGFNCVYFKRPYENILPFVEIVSKQVDESRDSLSLLYTMNRFAHLSHKVFKSTNQSVFESLQKYFQVEVADKAETDLYKEMTKLDANNYGGHFDFGQVSRWLEISDCQIPINKIIELALSDAVKNHLDVVQKSAMEILINEMNLSRHLKLLRNVYLCNDASLLLPFLKLFFKEESCWGNADYLTAMIRECIATDFPDLAENASIVVHVAEGQVPQNIIHAINSLEIAYQVSYPISLIITPAVLMKYNAIHRTLLKLKWAQTLSYLRFPEKKSIFQPAAQFVMHRLQILRFSCLTDLQVINNYFIAQVAATMSQNCEDYSDIQSLIRDHEHLIEKIHSRCMLSEGDQHYTLIFEAVIPLVVDLRRCWLLEESHIISKLKLMESIYRGTHTKLRRLMCYLERETYVPLVAKLREETLSATYQTQISKYASFV